MHVLMFMFTVSGVSRKYMMIMRIIVMVRNIIIAENDVRYKSIDNMVRTGRIPSLLAQYLLYGYKLEEDITQMDDGLMRSDDM